MTLHHEKLATSRKKLLDASLHVIRSKGYEATTVDDICAAAGLSKGSFFHHFKSKDDLIRGMVKRLLDHCDAMHAAAYQRQPGHGGPGLLP